MGEGEGGMISGNGSVSPGLTYEIGCLGMVYWDDPEGWYGEGDSGLGTRVHPWWIHVDVC